MKSEFFEITCYVGGPDDKLFISIVNQGIDAHLEAFTQSKFSVESRPPFGHQRRVLNFHRSELPIYCGDFGNWIMRKLPHGQMILKQS